MKTPQGVQLHFVVSVGFVATLFLKKKKTYLFPYDAENTIKCV
jgi:hypothetical protein